MAFQYYRVLKFLSPDQGPLESPGNVVHWDLSDHQVQVLVTDLKALEPISEVEATEPVPTEESFPEINLTDPLNIGSEETRDLGILEEMSIPEEKV